MRFLGLRQLCLGGILAAFVLTGCGSSKPANGYATFAWYIFDIQDTSYATALPCAQVGAATVTVTLTNVTDASLVYTQSAACADGVLSSPTVPAGAYYAGFDLYGDPAIYGNATTRLDGFDATDDAGNYAVFHIRGGANDFTASWAPFVAQSFTASWGIYAQSLPTTCAAVGADYVYLDFLTVDPVAGGSTSWVTSPFACATGAGVSYAIPYGPTTVQWSIALVALVNGVAQDLQVLPGGTVDLSALPASTDVNLGPQYFSF
jgi:hypothetical protein